MDNKEYNQGVEDCCQKLLKEVEDGKNYIKNLSWWTKFWHSNGVYAAEQVLNCVEKEALKLRELKK